MKNKIINKKNIINKLGLVKLSEVGGYFSQTYESPYFIKIDRNSSERRITTSIYYLLTDDERICYFHMDKSDVIHYFHGGYPITFLTIDPNGCLEKFILGLNILENQTPQLLVKGGYWKAAILETGEFGLLSEVLSPGFFESDEKMGNPEMFRSLFPDLWEKVSIFVRNDSEIV